MSQPKTSRHITEAHPNPRGEQTDHRGTGSENVAQNPSTRENRLNPSVIGPLEDPTTDSMFNLADQQVRELLGQDRGKNRSRGPSRSNPQQKTGEGRKPA